MHAELFPSNHEIKVLRQRGGYGFKLAYDNYDYQQIECPMSIEDSKLQEMPYIAIETSKTVCDI